MAEQFPPRLHNEVYPFISPSKFKGSLQDQVVIITGSSGTLGTALAECFSVAGGRLVLTYNRTAPAADLRDRCLHLGAAGVRFAQCNVGDLASCEALVQGVLADEKRIEVLVNNAGANDLIPFHIQDPNKFASDITINLLGPYYLTRLALPSMREKKRGVVLNISSRAATVAVPYSASYGASKAALVNLSACLQAELDTEGLGSDVHVYALHPGGVRSGMVEEKYSAEKLQHLPASLRPMFAKWLATMYIDSPHLNGMTCVALAAGVAKDCLRGRYVDVTHDLGDIVAQAAAMRDKAAGGTELYTLHTSFLGGMKNDGGGPERVLKEPVEFPGWEV